MTSDALLVVCWYDLNALGILHPVGRERSMHQKEEAIAKLDIVVTQREHALKAAEKDLETRLIDLHQLSFFFLFFAQMCV